VPARGSARRAARARAHGPAGDVAVRVRVRVRVALTVHIAVPVRITVFLRRREVRASSIVRVRVAVAVAVRLHIITARLHCHLVRVDSAREPSAEVCNHHLRAYQSTAGSEPRTQLSNTRSKPVYGKSTLGMLVVKLVEL